MQSIQVSLPLTIAIAALFLAPVAAARQLAAEAPVAKVEVKGATNAYDARRDDTAMKIVVGREEIGRYGDSDLLDVLKRIPGVTVSSNGGRGLQVQMRGLGGAYTQVLVNGERMPAGFSLDSLSPDVIERIEVMRAATAEFSTQSMAGTINIVLRRAGRKPQRNAKLGWMLARRSEGPNAGLDWAGRGEEVSYSLAAAVNRDSVHRPDVNGSEEFVSPLGVATTRRRTAVPERAGMLRFSLAPKLAWTGAGGDTLAWDTLVSGNRFRNRARALVTTETGAPPPLPDLRTRLHADLTSLRSALAWTHGLASGATLESRLGIQGAQDGQLALRAGNDARGVPASDGRVQVRTRDRSIFSTGKVLHKLDSGHALSAGWDGGLNRRDDARVERDALLPLPPNVAGDERFSARVARLALYAQDDWPLSAAWSAYAGVRWEGIRTHADGSGFVATRIASSVWSPLAQLSWKIPDSKGDRLRFAVSRTYKAPELASLVPRRQTWQNNDATEADYQGNPRLRPELAWGLDAAWEHRWDEGALLSASASLRRIGDYMGNRVYFDGYRWIMTPENIGRASTRGLELESRFPLRTLVADAPALDLRAGVSRNWSRVAALPGPDNRVGRQVPLSALLGVDYKAATLSAGASFAFKRAVTVRSAIDRWEYAPARRDLEAYSAFKPGGKMQLRLTLSNLLRQANGFGVAYADPPGGRQLRRWTYPDGVKLRATLETPF